MTDPLLATMGSAATAAGAVVAVFWKYEDTASAEMKAMVTRWLRQGGASEAHTNWSNQLVLAFNKIFGERHFSWRCIWRSAVASVLAVTLMITIWALERPGEFRSFNDGVSRESYTSAGVLLAFLIILFNCVPDYFSYMKTRFIIARMARRPEVLRIWTLVLVDTVLSAAMFVGGTVLASLVMAVILPTGQQDGGFWGNWFNVLALFDDDFRHLLTLRAQYASDLPLGIFLYASLFVSAWAWLYGLSAAVTRLALKVFPRLVTTTTWFFDVDGHPLRSFGCIAGGIAFLGVLTLKQL